MESSKKRKSRTRHEGPKWVAKTLAKWKEYDKKIDKLDEKAKPTNKVPAKGSKKGFMKGRGEPENSRGNQLWLGTFGSAVESALAYDEVAQVMYGPCARLNLPNCRTMSEYYSESMVVLNGASSNESGNLPLMTTVKQEVEDDQEDDD
ncbi:unnamed protein product [Lactuca saligna]|uniref:AP2/ERF domain-containing protein n=1 Tax=Lactuca saligna TaxID=75948 RepID=A0AA35UL07_LACSI|nr:unnamed protein product [Lactuca saligna]